VSLLLQQTCTAVHYRYIKISKCVCDGSGMFGGGTRLVTCNIQTILCTVLVYDHQLMQSQSCS